jgi:lipopolysaccharide/colanic/teichoic acid biosynthesis glycosyltransferase
MIRFLDILFSLLGLCFGFPVLVVLAVLGYLDTKSPLFIQVRIGLGKKEFKLIKFRTMRPDTASVASHLVDASTITPFGKFLRKTKLDELPQLWNVLMGDMSLVGPRPCLPNQRVLIDERDARGVYSVRPGITGLAQVNDIDMSTPELLAKVDAEMISNFQLKSYFSFIFQTLIGKGSGDRVRPN